MAITLERERPVKDILPMELMMEADELGIRLESIGGITVWEAMPLALHQSRVFQIQTSIRAAPGKASRCGCWQYSDVVIRFPDGSKKRPDVAIWCSEPQLLEEITIIPEAAIEILSRGYEKKDLTLGVPFYLEYGVKDVIVHDPINGEVRHFRRDGERRLESPVEIELECGCVCTV